VQAMLAVNDLFYLSEPHVASLFSDDVRGWFESAGVRYSERIRIPGKTGYDHLFDFIIPHSRQRPERLVRTVNHPGRDTANAVAFSWIDVQGNRPDAVAYAVLNDVDREPAQAVHDALRAYGVIAVPWSMREELREEFAA
jgi:hypothetical protein